jgi:uncharacterized protein (DUF302 family)
MTEGLTPGGSVSYYIATKLDMPFSAAVEATRKSLKAEGFGVLTEIDVRATLKAKLDVDFPDYLILGTCNPPLAYRALQTEERIGLMLPCNVIVRDAGNGVEVAAIDPLASMQAVDNDALGSLGAEVREKLARVIESLTE